MGAQDKAAEAQLHELRQLAATMTEIGAWLRGRVINNVLDVRTETFDATGVIVRQYGTAVGSVLVGNPSTSATVTVASGTSSTSTAPTSGTGVQVIPAGTQWPVPIASGSFTLYGTPGQQVSYQVFTGLQAHGISGR